MIEKIFYRGAAVISFILISVAFLPTRTHIILYDYNHKIMYQDTIAPFDFSKTIDEKSCTASSQFGFKTITGITCEVTTDVWFPF